MFFRLGRLSFVLCFRSFIFSFFWRGVCVAQARHVPAFSFWRSEVFVASFCATVHIAPCDHLLCFFACFFLLGSRSLPVVSGASCPSRQQPAGRSFLEHYLSTGLRLPSLIAESYLFRLTHLSFGLAVRLSFQSPIIRR